MNDRMLMAMTGDAERVQLIRSKIPRNGLFAEKEWRIAPRAFPLGAGHIRDLDRLGRVLPRFVEACNLLYRLSVEGRQPAWIHRLLDAGKPAELVELARDARLKGQLPEVLRPDLILTDQGFALSELDNVPGGIGLTAWLQTTYADLGEPVLGGRDGMASGFASVFPEGHCVISEEAATYRPEMEYLLGPERVRPAETYQANGAPVYRFFECFDWHRLDRLRATWSPGNRMTPPLKPYLEEKLWLALFWARPLQEYWRQHISEKGQRLLQRMIPYTWILDPSPLPHHAVIPELGVQDWRELADFSQRQRELVIKVSGFSELAWGSRGVWIGSDMPAAEWAAKVEESLAVFDRQPRILQRFTSGSVAVHDYVNDSHETVAMEGRSRVCPYYFVVDGKARLGGVLVTHCPKDKKLLHGMRDAILAPAKAAEPAVASVAE